MQWKDIGPMGCFIRERIEIDFASGFWYNSILRVMFSGHIEAYLLARIGFIWLGAEVRSSL